MLKPSLARGEVHCVGATTLDEYRQYIEKDAALARRFLTVFVDEPSVDDTVAILAWPQGTLRGPPRCGDHRPGDHRRGDAVASLHCRSPASGQGHRSDRRVSVAHPHGNRFEARGARCAGARSHHTEESSTKRSRRKTTTRRKNALTLCCSRSTRPSASIRSSRRSGTPRRPWLRMPAKSRKSWSAARVELETATRAGDLQRMSELQYGRIPELEKKLSEASEADVSKLTLLRNRVTDAEVAEVVARWTGISRGQNDGRRARKTAAYGGGLAQARHRPGRGRQRRVQTRYGARAPACRTRSVRAARSCFSGPPGWARPS